MHYPMHRRSAPIPEINFLIFYRFLIIIGGANLDRVLAPTTIGHYWLGYPNVAILISAVLIRHINFGIQQITSLFGHGIPV